MATPKLTQYTKASNCTDLADIQQGLKDIKEYFDCCHKSNKKPIKLAYLRLAKLHEKQIKLKK